MQKPLLLSRVRPTCKKVGRHAGLAARDAKKFLHRGQPLLDVAHVGPAILLFYCFTILLLYYFTPRTVLPRPMFGVGGPRCKKNLHRGQPDVGLVLPRTTTYYHAPRTTAERSFCISGSHPCISALLFYCFTILLFYNFTFLLFYYFTQHTVLPRPMFGVGCPRCKKGFASRAAILRFLDVGLVLTTTYYHLLPHITTYHHVLPRTTTYYHVLPRTTTYYHVLPRTTRTAERSFLHLGQPPLHVGPPILLFY